MPSELVTRDPQLRVSTEHGTVAATRFQPPSDQGAHPVVLVATPYRKDDWITYGSWLPTIRYLARQGFEVVVADVPGTGASTGTPTPFGRADGDSLAAVVDELADRSWATGSVGMFGLSYGAWTQYATAAEAPDALEAIVPVAVSPDGYASSYTGGLFDPLKRAVWATAFHARQLLPPVDRGDDRWRTVWESRRERRADNRPWLFRFLTHGSRDEFWANRRVSPDEVTVPTLAACGTRDVHTAAMVPFVDALDTDTRLIVGPWRHRMPHRGRDITVGFRRLAADWFDTHLRQDSKRADGPTTALPPVACWTEYDGGWTSEGGWQSLDAWPTVDTADTHTMVVTESGLRRNPPQGWSPVTLSQPVDGTVGMESMQRVGQATNHGVDTNADDARSLTVQTDVLENPLEVTGTPTSVIHVNPGAQAAVVAVRLIDVAPDGTAALVTSGRTAVDSGAESDDTQDRDSSATGPQVSCVEISLTPVSHVFEAGHSARLAVAAAHFPRTLPPNGPGRLRLRSTPDARSVLHLPGTVHTDRPTYGELTGIVEPATDVSVNREFVTDADSRWGVTREHTARTGVFRTSGAKTVEPPDGGAITWTHAVTAEAPVENPRGAEVTAEVTGRLEHTAGTVETAATSRISRTNAALSSEMTVDGVTRFSQEWEIQRD